MNTSSQIGPVSIALANLVSRGALSADALQTRAAIHLDNLAIALASRQRGGGLFSGFMRQDTMRGAYLVGQVGRGKTMLMDLFFENVALRAKRRVHFHEFMDEVHTAITAFRRQHAGKRSNPDPIAAVVKPIIETTRLLCLDEFQVQDITNAMLLQRLFEKLFEGGVVVVATSNVAPENLYENGLNRQLFLPFIDLLKANVDILTLDGPTDYRRLKFEGQSVYRFGTGPEIGAEMEQLWLRLTGGLVGEPTELRLLGRVLKVPQAAMGAARFPFAALCEVPLGPADYLRLSHAYDTIMIEDVPQFDRVRTNWSKRFITLIDTLYDRGVKLAASFEVPLDALGADEKTRFEFARCVSRLIEMQSADYLNAPHKATAPPQ